MPSITYLPKDVIIDNILSHLYPDDIEKCKEVNHEMKSLIENNEEYIDTICQHVQPHGKYSDYFLPTSKEFANLKSVFVASDCLKLKGQKYYKEGKLDGESKELYENGQIWIQKYYKEGKLDGEYKKWYMNGRLSIQKYYKDGKAHGEYKSWYSNGQLSIQANYKDEWKLDGEYKQWDKNGQLEIQEYYKEGN